MRSPASDQVATGQPFSSQSQTVKPQIKYTATWKCVPGITFITYTFYVTWNRYSFRSQSRAQKRLTTYLLMQIYYRLRNCHIKFVRTLYRPCGETCRTVTQHQSVIRTCINCEMPHTCNSRVRARNKYRRSTSTSSWSCVCWRNNLEVTRLEIWSIIRKCHLAKLMPPCTGNPKVDGVVAPSVAKLFGSCLRFLTNHLAPPPPPMC